MILLKKQVIDLYRAGLVIDGTGGGLVLGEFHETCGVNVIAETGAGDYRIVVNMEGFEYIMNPNATIHFQSRLKQMNDQFDGSYRLFEPYSLPDDITIIDAKPIIPEDLTTGKYVLISKYGQFVINRHSTKMYIKELERLNKEVPTNYKK